MLKPPTKITFPCYKTLDVYADFETYVHLDPIDVDLSNFDFTNEELRNDIFENFGVVVPWLLAYDGPRIVRNDTDCKYNQGRIEDTTLYPHTQFFEHLSDIWRSRHIPIIWFHNTTYDLTSSIETCFKELDPNLEIWFQVKDSNEDFIIGEMYSPKYKFKAKFADTMKYKRISLAKVAEMFNMEKGEIPYTMCNLTIKNNEVSYINWATGKKESYSMDKVLEYAINDVCLTRKYREHIKEFVDNTTTTILQYNPSRLKTSTVGIHAKNLADKWLWRKFQCKFDEIYRPTITKEDYERQKRSCNGGFTTRNLEYLVYICKENEVIGSFDVNSMYPFIMTTGLPGGDLFEYDAKTYNNKNWIKWYRCLASEVEWAGNMSFLETKPIPTTLQNNHKKKKDIDLRLEFYIPDFVYDFIKKNSTGSLEIIGTFMQEKFSNLGEYITKLYKLRQELKKEGKLNSDMKEFYKQCEEGVKVSMNSIYGKLCEQTHTTKRYYVDGTFEDIIDEMKETDYKSTIAGAYVTWCGRLMLYKKIKQLADANYTVLYADTDSIKLVYEEDKKDEVLKIFGENSGLLGQWKDEGTFHEYGSPARKKYYLLNNDKPEDLIFKFSGMNKPDLYRTLLVNNLIRSFETTREELRIIFSPFHNVLFEKAKTSSIKTSKYSQRIIAETNYRTNPRLKEISATVRLTANGYEFTRKK